MSTQELNELQSFLEGEEFEYAPFTFVPEIECASSASANNGIIKLTVSNIDDLWAHSSYDEAFESVFKLFCRHLKMDNSKCSPQWMEMRIFIANITDDGVFYLLLDSQLEAYKFEFKLQARMTTTTNIFNANTKDTTEEERWMEESKVYSIIVPSFVMDTSYELNEWIDFRMQNEFSPRLGQIIEVLKDDMFRVQYDEYKSNGEWIDKSAVVHLSRLYKQSIDRQHVTRIHAPIQLQQQLLIQSNDEYAIKIWNCIEEYYTVPQSLKFCCGLYDENVVLMQYKAISYFVAKHIFNYLFEPQFEFRSHCFINDADGVLELKNVRTNDIRNSLKLHQKDFYVADEDEDGCPMVDRFDDVKYACDFCWIDLGEWDLFYSCNIHLNDKHDFCLNCVSTVIRLNSELKVILSQLLCNELIKECIHEIADFVIGGVRVFVHQKDDYTINEQQRKNKRKIEWKSQQVVKKQKL